MANLNISTPTKSTIRRLKPMFSVFLITFLYLITLIMLIISKRVAIFFNLYDLTWNVFTHRWHIFSDLDMMVSSIWPPTLKLLASSGALADAVGGGAQGHAPPK